MKASQKQKIREQFQLASQNVITTLSKKKTDLLPREQELILSLLKKVQFIKLSFDTKCFSFLNLCYNIELSYFSQKTTIFKKGQEGNEFYIVLYGKCFVQYQTEKDEALHLYNEKRVEITYFPGDSFGQISLIYNVPRGATVVANRQTTLLKINKKHFNECTKFQKKLIEMSKFFHQHPFLELANDFTIRIFSSGSTREKFKQGDVLINEGKKFNYLIFFMKGKAKVIKSLKIKYGKKIMEEVVELQQLFQNSVFGEYFLVNNLLSNIKIVATDRGEYARVYLQEDITMSDTPLSRRIIQNAHRFPSEQEIFEKLKYSIFQKYKKSEVLLQIYKKDHKKLEEYKANKSKYLEIQKAELFIEDNPDEFDQNFD